jgi:hypothetical protein
MYYRIAGMYYRNTTQNREDMEEELSEKYDWKFSLSEKKLWK